MKVLIVDPDWRFARQAQDFLESHAHLVVHQGRAERTIERVSHWQPDLVILASELGEQGLLAELYQLEHRPAVLLTGWLDRYDIAWRAWQIGGDELLIKPILDIQDIHVAVVTALENAQGTARTTARAAVSA